MSGLGRLLAMQSMSGEAGRRNAEDEWRALHRRPDALPLTDAEAGIGNDRDARGQQALVLRRLITRFGHR